MAEAADMPHPVKLARFLLEAADEQHLAIGGDVLRTREGPNLGGFALLFLVGLGCSSPAAGRLGW